MALQAPFDFKGWIDEHRHLLRPPVGNAPVFEDAEVIVMVVGGPDSRTDDRIDPGEEFFYQLEGDMTLKGVDDGEFKDVEINEGQIFQLPPWVPHSPQRRADTVGLVIERKRREGELDGLRWYCEECHETVFEEFFHLTDIVKQLKPVIERYYASEKLRTCGNCGHVNPIPG